MDGVYFYGVMAAQDAPVPGGAGVADAPLRTIEHEDLAALVSDVDREQLRAAAAVRAHWRVLEAAATATTILPARFGAVLADDDAVRTDLLGAHGPELRVQLKELTGRVQLMVRGTYDETKLLSEVVGESPQLQQLSNEVRSLPEDATYHARIRLGELVADAVAQRREQDEARVRELLAPHAVAEQAQEPQDALAAFSLAYLVDRAGMDRFSAAVQKASDELGERIQVRYVGPVPPLSFVGDQGVAAWG